MVKQFVKSILIFLAMLGFPPALNAQINLSQGLVVYLPFSGNANDASGNGNNGMVNGATLTFDQLGNPNSAYYFDGVNDNIIIPHNALLNPVPDSGFSVCAQVKMQGFYNGLCYNNAIVTKGNNQSWSSVSYYGLVTTQSLQDDCYFQDTTNHNYRFDFNGNGNALGTQVNAVLNNEPHIQLNQWDCLVGIYKNDTSCIYVNGVLRYKLKTSSKPGNTDDLSIGFDAWSYLYPFWFHGVIDEVRIYSRALSSEEIITYCYSKPSEPGNPLVDPPARDTLNFDHTPIGTTGMADELNTDNLFAFYPNPAQDVLIISYNGNLKNYSCAITDIQGRFYKRVTAFSGEKQHRFDISDLANGVYILRIERKGMTPFTRKVIVNR